MKTASEKNAEQIVAAMRAFHKAHPEATAEQILKFHTTLLESPSKRSLPAMSGEEFANAYERVEHDVLKLCDLYMVPRDRVAISLTEGTEGFWLKVDGDKFVVVFRGIPSKGYMEDAVQRIRKLLHSAPAIVTKTPKRVLEFSQETGKRFRNVKIEVEANGNENEFFEMLPENAFEVKCEVRYTVTHKKSGESVTIKRNRNITQDDSHILFAAVHQISQSVLGRNE